MEQAIVSQTKIVKIGNSKGIVIPKKMLQAFGEEVRLELKDDTIVIAPLVQKIIPQSQWESLLARQNNQYDYSELDEFDNVLNDGLDEEV